MCGPLIGPGHTGGRVLRRANHGVLLSGFYRLARGRAGGLRNRHRSGPVVFVPDQGKWGGGATDDVWGLSGPVAGRGVVARFQGRMVWTGSGPRGRCGRAWWAGAGHHASDNWPDLGPTRATGKVTGEAFAVTPGININVLCGALDGFPSICWPVRRACRNLRIRTDPTPLSPLYTQCPRGSGARTSEHPRVPSALILRLRQNRAPVPPGS